MNFFLNDFNSIILYVYLRKRIDLLDVGNMYSMMNTACNLLEDTNSYLAYVVTDRMYIISEPTEIEIQSLVSRVASQASLKYAEYSKYVHLFEAEDYPFSCKVIETTQPAETLYHSFLQWRNRIVFAKAKESLPWSKLLFKKIIELDQLTEDYKIDDNIVNGVFAFRSRDIGLTLTDIVSNGTIKEFEDTYRSMYNDN